MRIVVHCPFVLQINTGITRYIFGLLRALAQADRENEYRLLWPPAAPQPDFLPPNFQTLPLTIHSGGGQGNPLARILRESSFLRRVQKEFPFDVFHSPHGYLPFFVPSPTVLTLPDLRVLRYPETFQRARGLFLSRIIPYSIRRANLTLAMSQATRSEVFALVKGVPEQKVRVAYPGVDEHWFLPVDEAVAAGTRARIGMTRAYILAVGTQEPHKNLPRLVAAWTATQREQPTHQLCLVGGTFGTGKGDVLAESIAETGMAENVILPGILTDDELRGLYKHADLLAFPSLYEGFGYPPLEAMAAGTPVLTSRASCLPEVVGDAAELVDPLSVDAMRAGILRVLSNEAHANDLRARGAKRVRKYTWQAHANEVIAAYEDVGTQSPSKR